MVGGIFILIFNCKGGFIMQGGVRKRGKTWSYYFDLGKIDGKRKKKGNGGFRTKKEAEQALTNITMPAPYLNQVK